MSLIWKHATPQNPCPICNKPDYCCFGDRAMKCMRVESAHACPAGGWYHFYSSPNPEFVPKAQEAPKGIEAGKMMRENRLKTPYASFYAAAKALGVLPEALIALGAAWFHSKAAWGFPMFDGYGEPIGIRLRNSEGFKWAVTGSRQGIFLPQDCVKPQPIAYLPEGPTDTAAVLSMGLFAIGRPTCNTGTDHIRVALRRLGIRRVVIVADNDDMKKLGAREGRPGIEGAMKLQKDLRLNSVIWIPPTKDVREFYKRGGTRELIESDVRNKVWTK